MMDAFSVWFEGHLFVVALIVIVLVIFLGKKVT